MNQLKHIALLSIGDVSTRIQENLLAQPTHDIHQLAQIKPMSMATTHKKAIQPTPTTEALNNKNTPHIDLNEQVQIVAKVNQQIARTDIDAVVIAHPLAQLEQTAILLHLCAKSSKPIVLTWANEQEIATSGHNLYQATLVATHTDAHNLGVLVITNNQIHSARFTPTLLSHEQNTCLATNTAPLGIISGPYIYIGQTPRRAHTTHSLFHLSDTDNLPRVNIIFDAPNTHVAFYKTCLKTYCAGVVIATSGGHQLSPSAQQGALLLQQAKIPVIRASQAGFGPVTPNALDKKLNTLAAHWWSPQAAQMVLSLCLKHQFNAEKTQHILHHY